MKIFLYVLVFLIATGSLEAKEQKKQERLVWPSLPDPARIEHISLIRTAEDFGIEKGFFAKISDFIFGEEKKLLSTPFGIHVDKNRVYVTDISSRSLFIFDTKEDELISVYGSKKENFLYPVDVVTDVDGNIYVSDSVLAKIFVFDEDGDFTHTIQSKKILRPVGIAINHIDKKLYVVDSLSSQIHIMTFNGDLIRSIGQKGNGEAEFNRPTYLTAGNDGKIYVSDSMNHRIQVLDKDGNFLNTFGQLGQNIGDFGNPRGIALDSDGNIYVSDTLFNNIQIFNPKGELLMFFGAYGGSRGSFSMPEDISILPNNTIYITDINNKRLQIFKRLDLKKDKGTK